MSHARNVSARFPQDLKDLGRTVASDVGEGHFSRTLKRDLRDLYEFYLDEERKQRLESMGAFRRWLTLVWYLLRSLFLKLTPVRRLLVLLSLWVFAMGDLRFTSGGVGVSVSLAPASVVILLFVLMLELRDKLLARDELEVGRAVQLALLPKENPRLDGWDVWLYTRPANDVGGDLVDHMALDEGTVGIALGDVSGKGLGAALLMAKLQSTLRAIAPETPDLARLGQRTNVILERDGLPGRFATLVFMVLSSGEGRVRFLNAGHMPPVLIRPEAVESLPSVALPVGVFADAAYREQILDLRPGDLLVVYSDGLTDARNAEGEFFSEDRLRGIFPQLRGLTAEEAGRRLLLETDQFSAEEKPFDDLSLVVLKHVGQPPAGLPA
jgi:sigma-B regulation protein RsbU (phosphoserine phosphatase)